jgi:hypothetical protein
MGTSLGNLRQGNLTYREGILALGMAVLCLLVAPVAYGLDAAPGLLAAALAWAVCWLGSAIALAISSAFRHPLLAFYGLGLAMMVRTGLPLAFALMIRLLGNIPFERSLIGYLMVFYLVAMAIEIPLSLPRLEPMGPRA